MPAETRVAGSDVVIADLVARASSRRPMSGGEGKSGARFERLVIDGEPYVLKHLCVQDDWTMRCFGDVGIQAARMWQSGLFETLPAVIDPTVVAVGRVEPGERMHPTAGLLMRDVGPWLVPDGDTPLPLDQHLRFIDHMARMHSALWDWADEMELTPLGNRYLALGPTTAEAEDELGSGAVVPRLVAEGWSRFPLVAPRASEVVLSLLSDPDPLLVAMQATPAAFVHGNWKAGNLGSHPDGRTILIDWGEEPGRAPPCSDLSWYLAINAARLPQSREDVITAYRASLEGAGVDTGGWWDAQLGLCLLGSLVQFGWEKALGGPGPELAWWEQKAVEGARYLA